MTGTAGFESGPNARRILWTLIGAAVSFLLWMTGVGLPLYIFPLLLVALYQGRTTGLVGFSLEAIAITLYSFLMSPYGETAPGIKTYLILFDLYVPLSLLAMGATWLMAKDVRYEGRFALTILPAAILLMVLGIAAGRDPALSAQIAEHYGNVFEGVVKALTGNAPDESFMNLFIGIFSIVTLTLALPLTLVFACASLFLYESTLHSRETDWEGKVASLELDGRIIWIFLASLAGILLFRFVSLPALVGIVLLNVAFLLAILYWTEGFSVLFWYVRKISRLKSISLFLMLAILLLMAPGINIIIILGLPLVGMLETFFDLRR